jgi:hypothetical protein
MTRVLQPELLDELSSSDPRAIHSRRDLRRINALMGNARVITRFVTALVQRSPLESPISIAEIGAGEGYIGAHVARALSQRGIRGNLLLIDRIPHHADTVEDWNVKYVQDDVLQWLRNSVEMNVIIANLFLHHLDDDRLRELLRLCADRCHCFAAAEPRRSRFAEWFAGRVKLVGCNDVTLHDAEISVRAGFNDSDLSRLWPQDSKWNIVERGSGLFTHFFGATRIA